jgi:peptidoglycan/xylan/chitin deacetylase (PgdA/CDA1 family)
LTNPAELSIGPALLYPAKAALTRARSAVWAVRTRGRTTASGIRILFYHRVTDAADELAATPRRFREQMELLARRGLRVVPVGEVAALLEQGEAPSDVVGLSFDDGYADVAENALPVLERLGFSATVFVATAVVDGTARFSWYAQQPPLLGWDEIGDLDRAGTLRFEAHTVTHPNLLALDDATARREIAAGKRDLEGRLGRAVEGFCYPAGLFGAREQALVAEAGFRWATSCEPGANTPDTDRYALLRRQIDLRDSLLDFRAKIGGGHDTPPPLRALYRRARFGSSES